ncbi:MAG: 16S rRNA (uracil(1498)-N(3))-methyltransferase [Clostridia bacterium]|nr:16S rRNA (uracil(1498)-N(3))-methyltransferase [Clostridia bacterium]
MKLKRYYVNQNLVVGENVSLEGDEFHHMANVMRTREGDRVELFCGDGNNYLATVYGLSKKHADLHIDSVTKSMAEPNTKLDVYQALAKGDKLSLITQKITELGASKLVLFDSKFCDVKVNTTRANKLDLVTISACKQCGMSTPVQIEGILSIKDVCKKIKSYDKFFVFYENQEGITLKDELLKILKNKNQKVAIMIGAEGGFEQGEIESLKQAGATVVSLGKRILRTETAAIAGAAVVMQLLD